MRRQGIEDELAGNAVARYIARSRDLGHDRSVRERERFPELTMQMPRALVDMGLVDGDETPAGALPRHPQRDCELGRVMAVVVVDGDPASFADELEPAPHTTELEQCLLRPGSGHARELERGESRCGVLPVVCPGHRELELDRLRTTWGTPASQLSKKERNSASDAYVA